MRLADKYGQNYQNLFLEAQMGEVPGVEILWLFGRNENVTTTETDIWNAPVQNYVFPTEANYLTVSSDNVDDTTTIWIDGLDEDYNKIGEEIVLNGTTPITTIYQYLRVNKSINIWDIPLIGNVTITHNTNNDIISYIPTGVEQDSKAIYTIPAGYTGYLFRGMASTSKLKNATILFKVREEQGVFILAEQFGLYQNTYEAERPFSRVNEKSDLKVSSISESAGTDITIQFGLLLMDNSKITN
jgi:hypothetical protein